MTKVFGGIMPAPRLTLTEALAEVLEPKGKIIADIGCGDGALVRHLVRQGAKVTGIEASAGQLGRALAKLEGREHYCVSRGERLPFGSASADVILYVNSFHHLPVDAMENAIAEAARVLKCGGLLTVIEPVAAGPYFEALRPLEDETEVRSAAYAVLQNPPPSLAPEGELTYETAVRLRDADHFIQAAIAPDPLRRTRLPQVEGELRRRFAALAQPEAGGFVLLSPMRRNVFRKT